MSLDDKLRRGLQTLDEPVGDPARELEKFRAGAYPRRARRRVVEAVVGTIAAAAIIAGATTAVMSSAGKGPPFIAPEPTGIPACRPGDVQPILATEGLIGSGRSKA